MPTAIRSSATVIATILAAVLATPAAAQVSSAYSTIEEDRCTVFAAPSPDEGGDWANLVCDGHRGYPVFLFYGDARESLFYGFPPAGDLAPSWESFDGFNSTGPTVEWRIATQGDQAIPFATIHRWFVSDPEDADRKVEVLVVEKVGQPHERDGCAVGYVVATGNPGANEAARRIADAVARDFVCGADQPSIEQGSVPLPSFTRPEY
jgi:hypothetical protein